MEPTCTTCGCPFQRKSKGFKRYSLLKVTTPLTAQRVFPDLKGRNGFICIVCVKKVRSCVKGRTSRQGLLQFKHSPASCKRKENASTPVCVTSKRINVADTPNQSVAHECTKARPSSTYSESTNSRCTDQSRSDQDGHEDDDDPETFKVDANTHTHTHISGLAHQFVL